MEIVFILVEPAVPGNIGSVARAINTMGYSGLRLVNPGEYLDEEALKFAHGSTDILRSASVYDSFQDASEDLDFIIATTAKRRSAAQDYYSCEELAELIERKGAAIARTGLVFGREKSGLPNEIIRRCDAVSSIPMKSSYPSLNLSQAVMIYAYTLFSKGLERPIGSSDSMPGEEGLGSLKGKLNRILAITSLDENQTLARRIKERVMAMGEDDIHLAHSFCNRLLELLDKKGH